MMDRYAKLDRLSSWKKIETAATLDEDAKEYLILSLKPLQGDRSDSSYSSGCSVAVATLFNVSVADRFRSHLTRHHVQTPGLDVVLSRVVVEHRAGVGAPHAEI